MANSQKNRIKGSARDDVLIGTAAADKITGRGGDDTLVGGAGEDLLNGGQGADVLDGGSGGDVVDGGKGDDVAIYTLSENGGAGDFYDGGKGTDVLRLNLTAAEFAALREELIALQDFIEETADSNRSTSHAFNDQSANSANHAVFETSFGLTVRNFEALEVFVDGQQVDLKAPPLFTEGDDTVDFNTVIAATYQEGTQYDGLGGDDSVVLRGTRPRPIKPDTLWGRRFMAVPATTPSSAAISTTRFTETMATTLF